MAKQDRFLKRISLRNRKATSNELNAQWNAEAGVKASSATVRRCLALYDLKTYRPRKEPSQKKEVGKGACQMDSRPVEQSNFL